MAMRGGMAPAHAYEKLVELWARFTASFVVQRALLRRAGAPQPGGRNPYDFSRPSGRPPEHPSTGTHLRSAQR